MNLDTSKAKLEKIYEFFNKVEKQYPHLGKSCCERFISGKIEVFVIVGKWVPYKVVEGKKSAFQFTLLDRTQPSEKKKN
jgi:hypothetical protein